MLSIHREGVLSPRGTHLVLPKGFLSLPTPQFHFSGVPASPPLLTAPSSGSHPLTLSIPYGAEEIPHFLKGWEKGRVYTGGWGEGGDFITPQEQNLAGGGAC